VVATILPMDMEVAAQVDTMVINQNATSKTFCIYSDNNPGNFSNAVKQMQTILERVKGLQYYFLSHSFYIF
jgi:hypothetical protein